MALSPEKRKDEIWGLSSAGSLRRMHSPVVRSPLVLAAMLIWRRRRKWKPRKQRDRRRQRDNRRAVNYRT
jgi:hypothetical protein